MYFLILLAAVLGLLCVFSLCVTFYNVWVNLNTWQKRIHIGRLTDIETWKSAITHTARKWIRRPPVVPKDDQHQWLLLDKLRGKYENSTIQSWQVAGLLLGLDSSDTQLNSKDIDAIIKKYGSTKNVERALLAYSLLMLADRYPDYRKAADNFAVETLNILYDIKAEADTIPYRKQSPSVRYVDTLGFVCPFLIKYSNVIKKPELKSLAKLQLQEYRSRFHSELNLPPHAYNIDNNVPMGVYDWGRGIGWYILALVESRRSLQTGRDGNQDLNTYLAELILELSENLIRFQKDNGGYAMFVTDTNGQFEASATSLSGLLFLEAYTISKDSKYLKAVERILKSLMAVTQRNGAIDLCQGDTKGIALYSTHLGLMPFIQGITVSLANRYVSLT